MKEYYHARVGATANEPSKLCDRADAIISNDTGNPDDVTPSPSLVDIGNKRDAVRAKMSEAEDSHTARVELADLSKELYAMLRDFCIHVDDVVAKGDKVKVLGTGCLPDKDPEAHGNAEAVLIARIDNALPQYSAKAFLRHPLQPHVTYDGQIVQHTGAMPDDENTLNWTQPLSGVNSYNLLFTGLQRGLQYAIRIRGNDKGKPGAWPRATLFIPQ